MGLLDKIKGEFVDIVEWTDDSRDTIVWRFPRYENQIKYGAKLTVRESQVAVFVNQGQVADVFQPGMYTLWAESLPILSTLQGWKYGFNSPFRAEVYFVNTRQFTDQKWGTQNPAMMRDADFGMVRVRAFGAYSFKVRRPGRPAARAGRHRPGLQDRRGGRVHPPVRGLSRRRRSRQLGRGCPRPCRAPERDRGQAGADHQRGPRASRPHRPPLHHRERVAPARGREDDGHSHVDGRPRQPRPVRQVRGG